MGIFSKNKPPKYANDMSYTVNDAQSGHVVGEEKPLFNLTLFSAHCTVFAITK